ncbi:MAG: HRDC domain-containing protein, partial [Eubacteriales bacterium]
YIRGVIDSLRIQGYLSLDESSIYKVPALTSKARDVLLGKEHVFMKEQLTPEKLAKKAKVKIERETVQNGGLLEQLKAERLRLARLYSVPAYVIFSDAALYDMCRLMPRDQSEFLNVSGVGKVKAERYGEFFIDIIRKFAE